MGTRSQKQQRKFSAAEDFACFHQNGLWCCRANTEVGPIPAWKSVSANFAAIHVPWWVTYKKKRMKNNRAANNEKKWQNAKAKQAPVLTIKTRSCFVCIWVSPTNDAMVVPTYAKIFFNHGYQPTGTKATMVFIFSFVLVGCFCCICSSKNNLLIDLSSDYFVARDRRLIIEIGMYCLVAKIHWLY